MSKLLEQINIAPRTIKKLGEVFEIIDGDRGANYPSKSELTKSGYCVFLNTKNVPSEGFDFTNVDFISKERDELLRKGKLERNDIVMTTRGTIGNVAHFNANVPFDCMRINSGMVILRSKPEVDRSYLYTLIKSSAFNSQLKNTASGSAQPQLPIKDLKEIELILPELSTQKKIASILSAYDEKIENNNKIIKNLETTAQTLFNEWFVNFKFPGHEKVKMVDSEMGEIPEEWNFGSVTSIFEINPVTRVKDGDEVPFVEMRDLSESGMSFMYEQKRKPTNGSRFKNHDTLIARITPCLENGKTGYVACLEEGEVGAGSTEFIVLRPLDVVFREFTYLLARNESFRSHAISRMIGSSGRQRVSGDDIGRFEFVKPTPTVIEEFHRIVSPMFSLIKRYSTENTALKLQRDQLLAKLI